MGLAGAILCLVLSVACETPPAPSGAGSASPKDLGGCLRGAVQRREACRGDPVATLSFATPSATYVSAAIRPSAAPDLEITALSGGRRGSAGSGAMLFTAHLRRSSLDMGGVGLGGDIDYEPPLAQASRRGRTAPLACMSCWPGGSTVSGRSFRSVTHELGGISGIARMNSMIFGCSLRRFT